MRRAISFVSVLAALVAVACSGSGTPGVSSATTNPASYEETETTVRAAAAIADASGTTVGLATFRETRLGVRVEVSAVGLPSGTHALDIRATGKCEAPDFATAGPVLNTNGGQPGVPGAPGSQAGALPAIQVGADGKGSLLSYSPHLSLNPAASNSLLFGAGTAVVVHAAADGGASIACGVVKKVSS